MTCAIAVRDATVLVNNLEIKRRDVANFFSTISQDEIEDAFIKAIEVGTFCLERATSAQDMDFVRRQIDALVMTVEARLSAIPSEVESALISKIGMSEGQVLAPIDKLVTNALTSTSDRFNEVKALFSELDPGRDGSATSRAIKSLKDLLDSNRKDSVQSTIITAITSVTAPDGALAKAVQSRMESGLAPLREEIDRLAKEIRGQDAAIEALSQTTAKGRSFEEEVVIALQTWAATIGAQLEHVGTDNKPGDIVVSIPRSEGSTLRLAIEARDRQAPRGRKAISETLEAVMVERRAEGAIYLSHDRQGLANEIGEWAEGECGAGSFVACTFDHLTTALRFLVVQRRLQEMRIAQCEIDANSILSQITRIRTAIDRVKTLNRRSNDIRGCASDIENEAGLLRSEIRDALDAIEDGVNRSVSAPRMLSASQVASTSIPA